MKERIRALWFLHAVTAMPSLITWIIMLRTCMSCTGPLDHLWDRAKIRCFMVFSLDFLWTYFYPELAHLQMYNVMYLPGFKLGLDSREKWLLRPVILGRSDSQIGRSYSIFCQFRSKLVITHTIVIKWKEKYNCHHSLCLCGDRMKKSLPKKNFFKGDSHFSLGPI